LQVDQQHHLRQSLNEKNIMKAKYLARNLFVLATVGVVFIANIASAFYSPDTGRWLNRDPIQEAGGLNLYDYVANNPINWIDPLGQDGEATLGLDPTLLMDEEQAAAYRAEQAAKKVLEELGKKCKKASENELKKQWKNVHKTKDLIKKQYQDELKKIGTKNPDIALDPNGNVVLQNPLDPTKIVPTGLPPSAFSP